MVGQERWAIGLSLHFLLLELFARIEENREELIEHLFENIAYLTRLGHCSYERAITMCRWERGHYMRAVDKLIREQNEASGGLPTDDD